MAITEKPHYELLDGLRGVAALLVVLYHINEGFAFASGAPVIDFMNHGYLAVDFFFILSGFVIGYAYDDRWSRGLTLWQFAKRRLIRLHPMAVAGVLLGALAFGIQGFEKWDHTAVSPWALVGALICGLLFIPAVPGATYEVRGNGEAFPLNGPAWSLFFEYIGNLLYAMLIRRLSTRALACLTAVLGMGVLFFTSFDVSGYGMFGVGWTVGGWGFLQGLLRMTFPFSMGLLMARTFRPRPLKGIFWICALALVAVFFVPYIPSFGRLCLNGVFESACIILVFPAVVYVAACGIGENALTRRTYNFMGAISYPLYITHYPVMYLFYAWLIDRQLYTFAQTWPVVIGVVAVNIAIAWLLLKFYDEPVRRWLTSRSSLTVSKIAK